MSISLDWWTRTNEHIIAQLKLVLDGLKAMKNLDEDETIVLVKPYVHKEGTLYGVISNVDLC